MFSKYMFLVLLATQTTLYSSDKSDKRESSKYVEYGDQKLLVSLQNHDGYNNSYGYGGIRHLMGFLSVFDNTSMKEGAYRGAVIQYGTTMLALEPPFFEDLSRYCIQVKNAIGENEFNKGDLRNISFSSQTKQEFPVIIPQLNYKKINKPTPIRSLKELNPHIGQLSASTKYFCSPIFLIVKDDAQSKLIHFVGSRHINISDQEEVKGQPTTMNKKYPNLELYFVRMFWKNLEYLLKKHPFQTTNDTVSMIPVETRENFKGKFVNFNNFYGNFMLNDPNKYDEPYYSIRFLPEFASVFTNYDLGKAFIGGSFCIQQNNQLMQYDLTLEFFNALYNAWEKNKYKFNLKDKIGDITNMQFESRSSAHCPFTTKAMSKTTNAAKRMDINSLQDFLTYLGTIDFTQREPFIYGGGVVAEMNRKESLVGAGWARTASVCNRQETFNIITEIKHVYEDRQEKIATFMIEQCLLLQIKHLAESTKSETTVPSTIKASTQEIPAPATPLANSSTNKKQTDDVTLAHLLKRLFPTKKAAFIGATAGTGLAFVGFCAALRYCNRSNPLDTFFDGTGKILNTGTTKTANLCCLIPGAQKVGTYLYTTFDHCFPKKI